MLRVAPVVRLLGEQLDGACIRDPQREQIDGHRNATQAQRQRALVRRARRAEHEERRAERAHREAGDRARNECDERRQPGVPNQAREHAAAQQKREQTQRREAPGLGAAQIARAQRPHRQGAKRPARELRAAERPSASFEQREAREVEDRARAKCEPETAQAGGAEVGARERRESPEILADLGDPELRLTALAVDELDRDLDRAQARAAARNDVRAARRKEAGHRIAHRRDRPGERGGGARRQLAPQRPTARRAAADVAAADRNRRRAVEERSDEGRDRRDRMREVGVHDDDHLRARRSRARDHRARETAFVAAHDYTDRVPARPCARALGRAVARIVVDDDHFERRERFGKGEDLPQQLVDVLRLVERGHDDRERRLCSGLDRFHRGCGRHAAPPLRIAG